MSSFLAEMWRLLVWWVVLPTAVLLALLMLSALIFGIVDGYQRERRK